ncbi:hypothetical protein BAU15_03910 [Enterococcus sp. JM4C]|uniref:FtsX-like permease family protein n=1 Tax=Candidatus Enterococcus huntleyi TaxID=1857217 RepID=UPI001379E17B|nr:FtsX-like permease family protein [Enterococcus sp. JM4C]KAF1295693.1 hypothetical protein BAU15_03910 [Enterococcus sp. JM4C]
MEKLKFIAAHGFLDVWRNRSFTRMILIYSSLCSLILSLGGRVYLNLLHGRVVEETVPDAGGLVNTRQDLVFILSILEKMVFLLLFVLLGLSFAYLLSLLAKEFIQQKEEFKIKAYIGTTRSENTGMFWLSYAAPYLIGEIIGLLVSQLIYFGVIGSANDTLKGYLLLPRYPILWVDLPTIITLSLLVCLTFLPIQRKMGGIENEETTFLVGQL